MHPIKRSWDSFIPSQFQACQSMLRFAFNSTRLKQPRNSPKDSRDSQSQEQEEDETFQQLLALTLMLDMNIQLGPNLIDSYSTPLGRALHWPKKPRSTSIHAFTTHFSVIVSFFSAVLTRSTSLVVFSAYQIEWRCCFIFGEFLGIMMSQRIELTSNLECIFLSFLATSSEAGFRCWTCINNHQHDILVGQRRFCYKSCSWYCDQIVAVDLHSMSDDFKLTNKLSTFSKKSSLLQLHF